MAVHMEYEEILEHVGSLGRYQIVLFNLIASFSWKYAANMVITVFHVVRPPFVCQQNYPDWLANPLTSDQIANLSKNSNDQCMLANSSGQPCRQFAFDRSQWQETIVTQWDLVCDKKALEPLVFASYALGYGFGVVLGILADKYGRRPIVLFSCAMEALFTLLECMSPNFVTYLALHFVHGIFATVGLLSTVCITEFVGCKHRAMVANLLWLYWCIGYMSVAGLAYFVRQWRWLQLLTCMPCLCYIACYVLLQESPRWLIANGRYTEALHVCETIARVNGRTIPRAATELLTSQAPVYNPEGNVKEMFKTRIMLKKTVILFCAWFAISLNYNSISLDSGFVTDDVFVNTVLSGLIEVPAYITAWIVAEKIGRRIPIAVLYVTLSACLIAVTVLTPGTVAHTILALLAKLSATCAFSIIINYTAEVYPTSIRNTGVFSCSAIGRVSAIIAPFIVMNDGSPSRMAAPIAFGCLGILAGAALYYLPETKGIPLPQTVQEANIITPGKEVAFIHLVQKRREEIAVYFVGRGEAATVSFGNAAHVELPTQTQTHQTANGDAAAVSVAASTAASAAGDATGETNNSQASVDDEQIVFSSTKYLINPYG